MSKGQWKLIQNSNTPSTPRLYSQRLNSVIYSATNQWMEVSDAIWRHFDTLLTSIFVSTTFDSAKSFFFSRQQRKQCM